MAMTLLVLSSRLPVVGAAGTAELEQGFRQPPATARPWVYWFWLNGNMTRAGITADLEAMQRAGVGGVLIMEVDQGAPVGPVAFMGAPWRELFQHVAAEAQRLGLEVNMNNDAGWNGSGGPWIKPAESMQEVVWTEMEMVGPQKFQAELPQPKTIADFYRDIAVQAFPSVGDDYLPNFEVQAAFQSRNLRPPVPAQTTPPRAVAAGSIVNLTAAMDRSGRLTWDVPAGTWTVVRLGHTCTGVENAPAPASGRGLECDKLSRAGIEANFAGMMAKLAVDVGPAAGKSLVATHIDSWENGSQNWTPRMQDEFQQRRGYDMTPFLPIMTGRVVDSMEVSQRFLADLRRTISELVIEHYAGRMHELAAERSLRFTVEAYGSPCDHLPYAGRSDEPMGEFWVGGGALDTCRGMASAAHVYGKRIVGAEAFTAGSEERWQHHPATLKALGDQAFCEGINRFVFHRYAMQPWTDYRPGMTMGPWGVHYERTQTWWEWTSPWHEYLSRCQFLLRQGLFVADICYLQAETSPQGFARHLREGYDWDECSAEVVLTRMSVQNGRLVLPDAMSYRLLVLPESRSMTPQLLTKIKQLVEAGATVVGPPPLSSPSLTGYPQCDADVKRLAAQLWGDTNGHSHREHRFGQGRVVWGMSPEQILAQDGVPPDFSSRARIRSIHRSTGDADIYFVANPQPASLSTSAAFRVTGKIPEFWWPDTGRIERAAVYEQDHEVTNVALPLAAEGSVFVVFRTPATSGESVASCGLDEQTVCSAAAGKPLPILIEKALYGPAGDSQRTRDVRAKIQHMVDRGQRSFRVSQIAVGDDPAEGAIKTLVVEYSAADSRFTASAGDPDMIHLTGEAANIVVTKARYGVLDDPSRTRNVREKVQRIADGGASKFEVASLAGGDDPAFLVVKTLELEYTRGGESISVTAIDPETVDLATPQVNVCPPTEVCCDENGTVVLHAMQPGHYELKTTTGQTRGIDVPELPPAQELAGPWEVCFDPKWGGPEKVIFQQLEDWARRSEDGVRHYSGTATYRKTFALDASLSAADRLVLDLGQVAVMADVTLNGHPLGIQWRRPFRLDVTEVVKPGDNVLEVRVVNLWINRMIGDEQLPDDSQRNANGTLKSWPKWLESGEPSPTGRFTFTSWRLWKPGEPLAPSGLLGPVQLIPVSIRQ